MTPVAVVATAGTTLTGAIDPLGAIGEVCAGRGVWLHVDGAYGLPAAARRRPRAAVRGIERADSVAVDAHKWLYLPKACGVVLVREPRTARPRIRARGGVHAASGGGAPRGRHQAGVLAALPGAEAVARFRVHGAAEFRAAIERNLAEARLLCRRDASGRRPRVERRPPSSRSCRSGTCRDGVADLDAHNDASRRRSSATAGCISFGAHRRPGVAAAVLRQLPDDRGGRRGDRRDSPASWVGGSPRRRPRSCGS